MNLEIREIPKGTFLSMVRKYHYSIVMPRLTKHYLGCYLGEVLVGGMSLGWGTQPKQTIRKLFPMLDTKDYFEIGKMVMLDEMPKNSESQMISKVVKWIKNNLGIAFLYTWADGIVGKPGYVYQAANFYYGGFIWTDIYITEDGEKIHPRSAKKLLKENAKFLGKDRLFWLTPDFCKKVGIKRYRGKQFRYIYPLSKNAKKLLSESTVDWNISGFPKHADLIWKVQISKGVYEETLEAPKFSKFAAGANSKNMGTSGILQPELL